MVSDVLLQSLICAEHVVGLLLTVAPGLLVHRLLVEISFCGVGCFHSDTIRVVGVVRGGNALPWQL